MDINEIIKPENLVYTKPRLMNDNPMHYCPGCSHGVVHKLIAEDNLYIIPGEFCYRSDVIFHGFTSLLSDDIFMIS